MPHPAPPGRGPGTRATGERSLRVLLVVTVVVALALVIAGSRIADVRASGAASDTTTGASSTPTSVLAPVTAAGAPTASPIGTPTRSQTQTQNETGTSASAGTSTPSASAESATSSASAESATPSASAESATPSASAESATPSASAESASASAPPTAARSIVSTSVNMTFDGVTRNYATFAPSTGSSGLPMIVFVAGTHAAPDFELDRDDLRQYVLAGQVTLVYPVAIGLEWNAGGGCCVRTPTTNPDDAGFVAAVTSAATAALNPDPKRIYLMGYSAGAKLAWEIVCAATAPFAAIATYGGNPTTACAADGSPLPVFMGYGANDASEPVAGKPGHVLGVHPPAAVNVDTWIARDGCSAQRRHTAAVDKQLTVVGYTPCAAAGLTVQFGVWALGNHLLQQVTQPRFGDVAWAFVSAHRSA